MDELLASFNNSENEHSSVYNDAFADRDDDGVYANSLDGNILDSTDGFGSGVGGSELYGFSSSGYGTTGMNGITKPMSLFDDAPQGQDEDQNAMLVDSPGDGNAAQGFEPQARQLQSHLESHQLQDQQVSQQQDQAMSSTLANMDTMRSPATGLLSDQFATPGATEKRIDYMSASPAGPLPGPGVTAPESNIDDPSYQLGSALAPQDEFAAAGAAVGEMTPSHSTRSKRQRLASEETLEASPEVGYAVSQVMRETLQTMMTPMVFAQYVRCALSRDDLSMDSSFSAAVVFAGGFPKSMRPERQGDNGHHHFHQFRRRMSLRPSVEYALVQAIVFRIGLSSAPSPRLSMYLREVVVLRIVRPFTVVRAIVLALQEKQGDVSAAARDALFRFLSTLIPWYNISSYDDPQRFVEECSFYLQAVLLILGTFDAVWFTPLKPGASVNPREIVRAACMASATFLKSLMDERIISLTRACARRCPELWDEVEECCNRIIDVTTVFINSAGKTPPASIAAELTVAKQWQAICSRIRDGLSAAVMIPFQQKAIRDKAGKLTLVAIMEWMLSKTTPVLGKEVVSAMREFLVSKESVNGDLNALRAIEHAASTLYLDALKTSNEAAANGADGASVVAGGAAGGGSDAPVTSAGGAKGGEKFSFKEQFRMCERMVRQLSEAIVVDEAQAEQHLAEWGGRERVNRLLFNVLPQVKNQLRSTYSCLILATVVVTITATAAGTHLVSTGIAQSTAAPLSPGDEVAELTDRFGSFAVELLKEAAFGDDILPSRSFGLFLMRLACRAGGLLRLCKCNYALAVRILRAWDVINGGKPFSDANLGLYGVETNQGTSYFMQAAIHAGIIDAPGGAGGANAGAGPGAAQGHVHPIRSNFSLSMSTSTLVIDASDDPASDIGLRLLCSEPTL
ncbi:hypothetical protein FVE85_4959 [Porphyridium purpureum]|uniref:Uncharacterized protein n=1 Tax=Porphyridium purpureum TaxID=35688 RepID=A0A5J4YSJ6_PORPP|nr:hypothetical protein FVE85_4959 [Porphyridium purpureum]|eukprot:POR1114..scf236_6